MAVLTPNYVKGKVKTLLPLGDTDLYDEKFDLLISAAISKLRAEGLDIEAKDKDGEYFFQEDSYMGNDYIATISYQILKDIDYDADMNYLTEQYITRANTIRCYITSKQS